MNHQWANQYVQQRNAALAADVRGDQMMRMAILDSEEATTEAAPSAISRLRARLSVLTGRTVNPVARPSGR